jgi:site-specific recombinase XerD
MDAAGISEGPHARPKGLRHGYGVAAITAGVPLNMPSKWIGHSKIETTAIYANALGEEQRNHPVCPFFPAISRLKMSIIENGHYRTA